MRALPTACGACAEAFIGNAELGRWSGKWNPGPFVLWFLPAAITSQLAELSLSPHLLPPFCHELENSWPTIILDPGSKQDILSNLRGGTPTSSCLQVGYCWFTSAPLGYFVLIHFQSFSWPLGHTAFQMKSAMRQIVIFDADDYPGLLQGSFKAFSYSSLPSF